VARRYLLDDFYDFQMCSRVNLLLYNPARYPDSIEPPQLLGSVPSYFSFAVVLYPLLHATSSSAASPLLLIRRFVNRDAFGSQLPYHGLSLSEPLSVFEQEVRDGLFTSAAPLASCIFDFPDPR
jgi:hypothetical protein